MGILLFSDRDALVNDIAQHDIAQHDGEGLSILLTAGASNFGPALKAQIEEVLEIDITGPKLSRLNFDVVHLAIVDLTVAQLLSSGGRRLVEVLGRLSHDSLTLAFYGEATGATGSLLLDGISAGLNLLPRCLVLTDLPATPDLNQLLAGLSHSNVRLLALDGSVSAHYDRTTDTVTASGDGSLLLTAFCQDREGTPTVRVQMLSHGMTRGWPV